MHVIQDQFRFKRTNLSYLFSSNLNHFGQCLHFLLKTVIFRELDSNKCWMYIYSICKIVIQISYRFISTNLNHLFTSSLKIILSNICILYWKLLIFGHQLVTEVECIYIQFARFCPGIQFSLLMLGSACKWLPYKDTTKSDVELLTKCMLSDRFLASVSILQSHSLLSFLFIDGSSICCIFYWSNQI